MGEIIQLGSRLTDENKKSKASCSATSKTFECESCVIPVDFSEPWLQVLRIKGKKLEEAKLALYKGDVQVDIPMECDTVSISARVLVKTRQLDYYFYCPMCGMRFEGSLEVGPNTGTVTYQPTWDEIREIVRGHILRRAESGEYPKCVGAGAEK